MSESASPSFCNWFRNDLIPGHCFFEPALFVETCYKIITTTSEEQGCEAVIDFIARAILALVLPIIALIALLCLIPGFPIKSLCTCFFDPPPPIPIRRAPEPVVTTYPPEPETHATQPDVPSSSIPKSGASSPKPHKANIPPPEPATAHTPSAMRNVANKSIPRTETPKSGTPQKKPAAQHVAKKSIPQQNPGISEAQLKECLNLAHHLFDNINEKVKNVNLLRTIGELLESAAESLRILSEAGLTPGNPLQNEYNLLRGRYLSIKERWDHLKMDQHNVISVASDGNCLFSSFVVSKNLSYDAQEVKKVRKETVDWMRKHHSANQNLQQYLLQSLAEHYGRKQTNLINEQESINFILSDGEELGVEQTQTYLERIEKITAELKQVDTLLNVTLPTANGDSGDMMNFSLVKEFIPSYLDEMACDGVHGGAAEIYALSCLNNKDASVHEYENGRPSQKKYQIIGTNRSPQKWYIAIYNMPGTRSNHYSPFIPTWQ